MRMSYIILNTLVNSKHTVVYANNNVHMPPHIILRTITHVIILVKYICRSRNKAMFFSL